MAKPYLYVKSWTFKMCSIYQPKSWETFLSTPTHTHMQTIRCMTCGIDNLKISAAWAKADAAAALMLPYRKHSDSELFEVGRSPFPAG